MSSETTRIWGAEEPVSHRDGGKGGPRNAADVATAKGEFGDHIPRASGQGQKGGVQRAGLGRKKTCEKQSQSQAPTYIMSISKVGRQPKTREKSLSSSSNETITRWFEKATVEVLVGTYGGT